MDIIKEVSQNYHQLYDKHLDILIQNQRLSL